MESLRDDIYNIIKDLNVENYITDELKGMTVKVIIELVKKGSLHLTQVVQEIKVSPIQVENKVTKKKPTIKKTTVHEIPDDFGPDYAEPEISAEEFKEDLDKDLLDGKITKETYDQLNPFTTSKKKPTTKKLNPKNYALNEESKVYRDLGLDKVNLTDAEVKKLNSDPDLTEDYEHPNSEEETEEISREGLCDTKKANGNWCTNKAKKDGKCGIHSKKK